MKTSPRPLVDLDTFKSRLSEGKVLDTRKEFAGTILKDAGDTGALDFVLSTATVDRHGDVVKQEGWRLDNYRKNPVVLWAHDSGLPPVAKAPGVAVELREGGAVLVARAVDFVPREVSETGWAVGEMYRRGFLNAVSVGFRPLKWAWNQERGSYAVDFEEQELLEFSAVPVPANPEALVGAKAAGLPMAWLVEWAEKTLDTLGKSPEEARRSLIVPVSTVEHLRASLVPKQVQVPGTVITATSGAELDAGDDVLVAAVEKLTLAVEKNTASNERLAAAVEKSAAPTQAAPPTITAPPATKAPSAEDVAREVAAAVKEQLARLVGRTT